MLAEPSSRFIQAHSDTSEEGKLFAPSFHTTMKHDETQCSKTGSPSGKLPPSLAPLSAARIEVAVHRHQLTRVRQHELNIVMLHSFSEFSPCLSRACLGKMIVLMYKWRKKWRFSHRVSKDPRVGIWSHQRVRGQGGCLLPAGDIRYKNEKTPLSF